VRLDVYGRLRWIPDPVLRRGLGRRGRADRPPQGLPVDDGQDGEPALDGHSLSAAAGNGLAVLLRLAERSVGYRIPMELDF
jgi:hypothetical protein